MMSSAYAFFVVASQHLPQTRKWNAKTKFVIRRKEHMCDFTPTCMCMSTLSVSISLSLSLSLGSIWPCLRPRAYWSNRWVLFLSLKGVTFFYFSLLRPHFFRDKVQAQGGKLRAERAIDILTHRLEKKFCWSERTITSFNHITVAFKKAATLTVDIPCHSSQSVWGLTSEGKKRY